MSATQWSLLSPQEYLEKLQDTADFGPIKLLIIQKELCFGMAKQLLRTSNFGRTYRPFHDGWFRLCAGSLEQLISHLGLKLAKSYTLTFTCGICERRVRIKETDPSFSTKLFTRPQASGNLHPHTHLRYLNFARGTSQYQHQTQRGYHPAKCRDRKATSTRLTDRGSAEDL